jgi:hypothetical protein
VKERKSENDRERERERNGRRLEPGPHLRSLVGAAGASESDRVP